MTEPQHVGVRMDSIERAVADIAAGKAVVVVDDEDRENEGDIIFAASKATPELMAFTIRHSSGVICVPMPADMLDRLEIPLMTPHNKDKLRTAYTISVDARDGGVALAVRPVPSSGGGDAMNMVRSSMARVRRRWSSRSCSVCRRRRSVTAATRVSALISSTSRRASS